MISNTAAAVQGSRGGGRAEDFSAAAGGDPLHVLGRIDPGGEIRGRQRRGEGRLQEDPGDAGVAVERFQFGGKQGGEAGGIGRNDRVVLESHPECFAFLFLLPEVYQRGRGRVDADHGEHGALCRGEGGEYFSRGAGDLFRERRGIEDERGHDRPL